MAPGLVPTPEPFFERGLKTFMTSSMSSIFLATSAAILAAPALSPVRRALAIFCTASTISGSPAVLEPYDAVSVHARIDTAIPVNHTRALVFMPASQRKPQGESPNVG